MKSTYKLAIKNLTRQKRRNAILAIAIAFGFFVVTMIDALTSGMVGNLENMVTSMTGGTVLIAGYEQLPASSEGEKPKLLGIVRDKDYIRNIVENNDIDYKYFSCFTQSAGQVVFNGKKSMSTVRGRDFSEKDFINSFQIKDGSLENLADPQALIISDTMAESMNLAIGDQLIYTTSTIYGQNNVADFTVALIIKSSTFLDSMQTYANIETVNEIIGIPEGGYTTFTIFLNDKKKQSAVANKIEDLIRADGVNVSNRRLALQTNPAAPEKGILKQFTDEGVTWEGVKYAVETLNDALPPIQMALSVVHIVTTCILLVILFIVMVGVSNTYRMVLYERIREIGTMRALGMTAKDTKKVFTTEAVLLCVIGALIGLITSFIAMGIIHAIPVRDETLQFFLEKGRFSFVISPGTIFVQYLLLIVLTSFAVRTSAKKASKLSPAEALRTVK